MAANNNPIFIGVPESPSVTIGAANTSSTGSGTIGTDIFKVLTAEATNGSYIEKLIITPVATVANTNTAATVLRFFISTQSAGATSGGSNTFNIGEITAAAQTADSSSTAVYSWVFPIGRAIQAGYSILATSHAAPNANTSWQVTAVMGDY